MNGTTSTTHAARSGDVATMAQARIADLALSIHQLEHGLDVPAGRDLDLRRRLISIFVSGTDAALAWLASIAVDTHVIEPTKDHTRERHVVMGRLPDMGFRVELRYYAPPAVTSLRDGDRPDFEGNVAFFNRRGATR